jgi:effector-binding domain-containing protein
MIEAPQVITTTAQHTAIIHLKLAMSEMMEQFGPAVGELIAAVAAQGQRPAGPVFAHHLSIEADCEGVPESFDFELSVPVAQAVVASGRMKPSTMPALRAAKTTYHGPYEGLPAAWGEFMEWIKAQGLTPAMDLYEIYASGPESGHDASAWRTEFVRPLVG